MIISCGQQVERENFLREIVKNFVQSHRRFFKSFRNNKSVPIGAILKEKEIVHDFFPFLHPLSLAVSFSNNNNKILKLSTVFIQIEKKKHDPLRKSNKD